MRGMAVLVMVVFAVTAEAGIYKCLVNGRTVFSQRPCGEGAEEVRVRYQAADPAAAQGGGSPSASNLADRVILDRRIRAKEQEITKYQRQRDAEMAVLRARKTRANNNLAGATWEQSISTEMVAVAEKYRAMIDVARGELQVLREQRQALAAE
jgi:hypothetical protein